MDCKKFNEDINRISALRDQVATALNKINETGASDIPLKKSARELKEESNSLIEKYYEDFKEQNPEIFSYQCEAVFPGILEELQGEKLKNLRINKINDEYSLVTASRTSDYELLYYLLNTQSDGSFSITETNPKLVNSSGYKISLRPFPTIAENQLLARGSDDKLYPLSFQDGELVTGNPISGPISKETAISFSNMVNILDENHFILKSTDNRLFEITRQDDGSYSSSEPIEGFQGHPTRSGSIASFSKINSEHFIVGSVGTIHEYKKDENGNFVLSNRFEQGTNLASEGDELDYPHFIGGFNTPVTLVTLGKQLLSYVTQPGQNSTINDLSELLDTDDPLRRAENIHKIDDDHVLIVYADGNIREFLIQSDGNLSPSAQLASEDEALTHNHSVTTSVVLDSKHVLVASYEGLFEIEKRDDGNFISRGITSPNIKAIISGIAPIDENHFILRDIKGGHYECTRDNTGAIKVAGPLSPLADENGQAVINWFDPKKVNENAIFVGSPSSKYFYLRKDESLERLKSNLLTIAAKGDS